MGLGSIRMLFAVCMGNINQESNSAKLSHGEHPKRSIFSPFMPLLPGTQCAFWAKNPDLFTKLTLWSRLSDPSRAYAGTFRRHLTPASLNIGA
jgi:hypothetical protein